MQWRMISKHTVWSSAVVVCYTEKDFIEYLNRYICTDPSSLVTTLHNVYCKEELPEKYRGLPYFNF